MTNGPQATFSWGLFSDTPAFFPDWGGLCIPAPC